MAVRNRSDLRRRLTEIAARQSGYFTAAQARDVGYSYPAQHYHVEHGNWERVERGIFRLPAWPVGPHDDLVRWFLWSRGKAVVSHESALAVYELGDVDPPRVHLTVPSNFRARAHGLVLHRGELPETDVSWRDGFRITTPLRSLVDVAAGDLEVDHLSRAVADALARGLVTRGQLRQKADDVSAKAGLRIERALLEVAA
jgi:predicted transcriptional regulator of viral defense system